MFWFWMQIELESTIIWVRIAGSGSVHYQGAVSYDVVKHDLNNTSFGEK